VNQPKDEIPVSSPKNPLIKAKNELFQRSLFAARMAYDQTARRTKVGRLQDDHDHEGGDDDPDPLGMSLEDQTVPILSELEMIPVQQEESINAAGPLSLLTPLARANPVLPSEYSESTEESVVPVAASSDEESISDDIISVVAAARDPIMFGDLVKESPIDTNISRVQPRSLAEEAQLSAKYAAIENLGDRAFAILRDLQMI
jgi:hypothetical protein